MDFDKMVAVLIKRTKGPVEPVFDLVDCDILPHCGGFVLDECRAWPEDSRQ